MGYNDQRTMLQLVVYLATLASILTLMRLLGTTRRQQAIACTGQTTQSVLLWFHSPAGRFRLPAHPAPHTRRAGGPGCPALRAGYEYPIKVGHNRVQQPNRGTP